VDETVVREQVVISCEKMCDCLTEAEVQNNFAAMILRLGQSQWFMGRVTSCHLFHLAYPKSGNMKEKLRKKFVEMCNDETPMIRKAAAQRIGQFGCVVEKQNAI
jgi:serine/threonine-protein phosphatase 2A regulatory subunit A